MQVLGLGEVRPSVKNDTLEGRNTNRRVVIVVLGQPGPDGRSDPVEGALAGVTAAAAADGPTVLVHKAEPVTNKIKGKNST